MLKRAKKSQLKRLRRVGKSINEQEKGKKEHKRVKEGINGLKRASKSKTGVQKHPALFLTFHFNLDRLFLIFFFDV